MINWENFLVVFYEQRAIQEASLFKRRELAKLCEKGTIEKKSGKFSTTLLPPKISSDCDELTRYYSSRHRLYHASAYCISRDWLTAAGTIPLDRKVPVGERS
ncbi:hypothetical protein HN011_007819 [Eciton burchellii]|nr:hypothetical protein HN011_007819 [Eciton burchellii]